MIARNLWTVMEVTSMIVIVKNIVTRLLILSVSYVTFSRTRNRAFVLFFRQTPFGEFLSVNGISSFSSIYV